MRLFSLVIIKQNPRRIAVRIVILSVRQRP